MYCGKIESNSSGSDSDSDGTPPLPPDEPLHLSLFLSGFCDPQYRGKKKSNSSDHDGTPPLPPDEPPLLPLSVFLSRFRDRYLGKTQHEEDLKKFWSSGEEVLDSSEDEIEEILADEGHDSIFCVCETARSTKSIIVVREIPIDPATAVVEFRRRRISSRNLLIKSRTTSMLSSIGHQIPNA